MTFRVPFVVMLMCGLLLGAGCGSSSSAPGADGDTAEAEREAERDGSSDDCGTVCLAYCEMAQNCRTAGFSYYECRANCEAMKTQADFQTRYACGTLDTCERFMTCQQRPADLDFSCTGLLPAPDGDAEPEAIDETESERERENETEAADPDDPRPCAKDGDCAYAEYCDPVGGNCATACDPTLIFCALSKTCRPIPTPDYQPRGVCVAEWTGQAKGEACSAAQPCAPGLFCGASARCETICNRQGTTDCGAGLSCAAQTGYAFDTCRYCQGDAQCGTHRLCRDGLCVSDGYCMSRYDCAQGEVCIAGACGPGCVNEADCQPGLGLCDAGLCYVNQCAEDCAAKGLCCARHECGPCCASSCGGNQLCAYAAECSAGLSCCVEQVDCRARPLGYCGTQVCDTLTGTCCAASANCLAIDGDADAPAYACPTCASGSGTYRADISRCAAPFAALTLAVEESGCRVQVFKGESVAGEKLAELATCDRSLLYDSGVLGDGTRCVLLLDGGLLWKCETGGKVCRADFKKP